MDKDRFAAILPLVVGGLVNRIIEESHVSEDEALDSLYNSKLYTALENEDTKVWTYSVSNLYKIYQVETETGSLVLPEY